MPDAAASTGILTRRGIKLRETHWKGSKKEGTQRKKAH